MSRPSPYQLPPRPRALIQTGFHRNHLTLLALLLACDGSGGGSGGKVSGAADGGAGDDGGASTSAASSSAAENVGPDADNDGLSDSFEGSGDADMDGIPDGLDEDSDGDGISDLDEGLGDSDGDGIRDSLDTDSDNDGVGDATEASQGTDPRSADSDGDGTDDLVELSAGTDPLNGSDSPASRGDFFFRVPYQLDPDPARAALVFEPALREADVYFMMDSSISMGSVIDGVKSNLVDTIVPGVTMSIPDVQVGAGEFDQCPNMNVTGGDVGIRHVAGTTADAQSVATALDSISANGGPREPYGLAAWLFATGNASAFPALEPMNCPPGRIGYGCVRPSAVPILVMIGDENYSQGDDCSPSEDEIADALNAMGAKLVVLGQTATKGSSNGEEFNPGWTQIAEQTGSVDSSGRPFFFATERKRDLEGDEAGQSAVNAVRTLAEQLPLTLRAQARDLDDDGVDASLFITRIDANAAGGIADPLDPNRICVGGLSTRDDDSDGHDETFVDVLPGTPVCFDIIPARNETVMPTTMPQVFKAAIDVVTLQGSVLDTREVYFLVPPDGIDFEVPLL